MTDETRTEPLPEDGPNKFEQLWKEYEGKDIDRRGSKAMMEALEEIPLEERLAGARRVSRKLEAQSDRLLDKMEEPEDTDDPNVALERLAEERRREIEAEVEKAEKGLFRQAMENRRRELEAEKINRQDAQWIDQPAEMLRAYAERNAALNSTCEAVASPSSPPVDSNLDLLRATVELTKARIAAAVEIVKAFGEKEWMPDQLEKAAADFLMSEFREGIAGNAQPTINPNLGDDPFAPAEACGHRYNDHPGELPCVLPSGHKGEHEDEKGYLWANKTKAKE